MSSVFRIEVGKWGPGIWKLYQNCNEKQALQEAKDDVKSSGI